MDSSSGFSLYINEDVAAWRSTLEAYDQVLEMYAVKVNKRKKDRDLVALDKWYQCELPAKLKRREKLFINLEELCQLMKWKLTRGKFRPRLSDLVKANDETTVENTSRKAFDCLPDISSAIRELSKLKAIGPATASAVLSAGAPDMVPFMADEAMTAIPNFGEISYTLPFYMKFWERVNNVKEKLMEKDPDGHWTAHKVELALWTEVMARKCDFPLSVSKESQVNGSSKRLKRKIMDNGEAVKPKAKRKVK